MVGWSQEHEEIVVWYYDVAMAEDADLSEVEMEEARAAGELLSPVEVSSLSDIRRWIKVHKKG